MKRILMTLAAVLLTTATADAGPLRNAVANWRASRGGCGTCHQTQAPQPQPGPVQQAAGTVLVGTGQAVQTVGQTVQSWPGLVRPTCSGGTCSGGVCR